MRFGGGEFALASHAQAGDHIKRFTQQPEFARNVFLLGASGSNIVLRRVDDVFVDSIVLLVACDAVLELGLKPAFDRRSWRRSG